MVPQTTSEETAIVRLDNFIRATRDSGYKGTTSAIAELVDNSLQAGAKDVQIRIEKTSDPADPWVVIVLDSGTGMDRKTLRQALRFGGTTRFGDRSGTGRYGMGLPNASLSQAQRVEVFTWLKPGKVIMTYLDVEEIVAGKMKHVPEPVEATLDMQQFRGLAETGTVVIWRRCDRLDHRRVSTIERHLTNFLGRVFRLPIWSGVKIRVNETVVQGVDPLHLHPQSLLNSGRAYGNDLTYKVRASADGTESTTGTITVRFSELPVQKWHALSNAEKREFGVTGQPVVSVVRGNREIDAGWFFMGKKRRENYDDWWRCEVRFEPVLDEFFGITHTKQQIRPAAELLELMSEDIERVARVLNARARQKHGALKSAALVSPLEELAARNEDQLPPLKPASSQQRSEFSELAARSPMLREIEEEARSGSIRYALREDKVTSTAIYVVARDTDKVVVLLNTSHAFYRKVYGPMTQRDDSTAQQVRQHLDMILLAAARSEELFAGQQKKCVHQFRREWSRALATYLKG